MSVKQEPTLEHSYLSLVLSAVEQSCQTMRSMWDISSLSVKAEALQNTGRLIAHAIEALEENLEEQS